MCTGGQDIPATIRVDGGMDSIKGGLGGKGFGSGRQIDMSQLTTPVPSSITPTTSAQTTNPGDTFKFFNQPEFLKSTSGMQSYKNGGIIEALMMTPIGQNELKKLAVGGVVGGLDTLVSGGQQTGASLEDISLGKATFFEPFTYKTKAQDTLESIEETLGITPKKKIIENQEQFGDDSSAPQGPQAGPGSIGGMHPSEFGGDTEVNTSGTDWGALGRGLANAGSAAATIFGSGGLSSLFSVGNALFNRDSLLNKAKDYLTGQPDPDPPIVEGPPPTSGPPLVDMNIPPDLRDFMGQPNTESNPSDTMQDEGGSIGMDMDDDAEGWE